MSKSLFFSLSLTFIIVPLFEKQPPPHFLFRFSSMLYMFNLFKSPLSKINIRWPNYPCRQNWKSEDFFFIILSDFPPQIWRPYFSERDAPPSCNILIHALEYWLFMSSRDRDCRHPQLFEKRRGSLALFNLNKIIKMKQLLSANYKHGHRSRPLLVSVSLMILNTPSCDKRTSAQGSIIGT